MTQEEKDLLLQDLCSRLPYGVCAHIRYKEGEPCYGKLAPRDIQWFIDSKIENIKPYLRPMSSMTEEENKEFAKVMVKSQDCSYKDNESATTMVNDWYLSKGFDVRGLIPKGLALEAPDGGCICENSDNFERVEQNPTWSEEDEKILNSIICSINASDAIDGTISVSLEKHEKKINWLKSLKDRVLPQPKQEWSKEDKTQLNRAIYMMEQLDMTQSWDDVYNFLKSLKKRYTWKPSEFQIEALESATENCAYSEYQDCLRELIRQLKKLRGE